MEGKDENTIETCRAKPTLVPMGKYQVTSTGVWNDELIYEHLLVRGRADWVSVGDLAKVAYHQNIIRTKRAVRKRLSGLMKALLNKGLLLIVEREGPNEDGIPPDRAKSVKIYDPSSGLDRQTAETNLERMKKRREITGKQYDDAMSILDGGLAN